MPVTIEVSGDRLSDLPLTTAALMREVGLLARERIVRRTLAGRDASESAFRPYSAGYAKQKQKELGVSQVNLQVSGEMLDSITLIEVTETSVTLGFNR